MLLAVDIGNTHTVFGLYEGEMLRGHWRFFSDHTRTMDECGLLLSQSLLSIRIRLEKIEGVVIASVVPPLTSVYSEMAHHYLKKKPVIVSADLQVGIQIGCTEPSRVGADRIANAVGAYEKYGGPTIVVDLGTATTFDVITEDGIYLGGVIAPGMETSAAQLFQQTAQLPRVELIKPKGVIGRNTEESLRSGIFYGTVGQIDEIVRQIKRELGGQIKVVATGGLASLVANDAETVELVEPFLTLEGLRLIFHRTLV